MNKIHIPNYLEINQVCIKRMLDKFPDYKNTWMDFALDDFWPNRIDNQNRILQKALHTQNFKLIKKEIIDLINILSMTYHEVDHNDEN